jgi:hypothetical protein
VIKSEALNFTEVHPLSDSPLGVIVLYWVRICNVHSTLWLQTV